jgi:hypothetical protein
MTLILHQAMTDLRANRWLVAAWAAMLAAACAIEALKLEASLAIPLFALSLGRVVLGWVLAIRIVHADPLDGTSAFWLTRPLSRRMLLAAKGGLIGMLLLVVPAIGAVVVFTTNGVAIGALPGILGQWLLIEALPLLPIVLVATLTRDVARLVLTLLAGLPAWWALQLSCWAWSMLPVAVGSVSAWQPIVVQAWLVVGSGVVVLCSVLIARQYLTRRTGSIAVAALVAALGITAIAALWPVQLMMSYRPSWDEPGAVAADSGWRGAGVIEARVPAESLRLLSDPDRIDRLVGDLRVEGLDDDVVVDLVNGRGTLRFPNEGEIVEQRRIWASGFNVAPGWLADEASRRHFERVLSARLLDPFPAALKGLRLVAFKPGVYAGRQGTPAVYDANITFDAYRVEIAAAMPLKVGAMGRVGDVVTTVLAIRTVPKQSRPVIEVRQVVPRILLSDGGLRVVHLLRNRKRSEVVLLAGGLVAVPLRELSATCILARRQVEIPNVRTAQGIAALDAAWLDDTELVFVSLERLGRFTKRLTVPNFVLPAAR